jgi:actin-related protein 5
MARYRDRKLARTFTFVGSDVYSDGTARGQSKNVYEPGSNIVNNWDCMEGVLDYCFIKLGVDGGSGSIDRPVVLTEPVANLGYTRKSTYRYRHALKQLTCLSWSYADSWNTSHVRGSF